MTADYRAQAIYDDRDAQARRPPQKQRAAQPERHCAARESKRDRVRLQPRSNGQEAIPNPNTCILPALTWRGSVRLDTILPAGTGIVCAKM
ncbi:hypothetical protein BGC_37460 [Burkholderia sp. 3C]